MALTLGTSITDDYKIKHAIDVVYSTYGDVISVDKKKKDLIKFGSNPNVGNSGRFTIWYTGQDQANESYVADNVNSIDSISSSSTSDAEVVVVEGHSMIGGNRTFVSQQITLSGRNRVALTTSLNRVTRVSHADLTNTDLVGEIYVYQDTALTNGKPTDTTKIHITIPAGENQSQKASTSLSQYDYWIVTQFSGGLKEKAGSNFTDIRLETRNVGGVFKPKAKPLLSSTGTSGEVFFNPYLIIPKNSDVRLTAQASTTSQDVIGDIEGYLAIVTNR